MFGYHRQIGIREMLRDPLIELMMKADGVNLQELELMLTGVADDLSRREVSWGQNCLAALKLKLGKANI